MVSTRRRSFRHARESLSDAFIRKLHLWPLWIDGMFCRAKICIYWGGMTPSKTLRPAMWFLSGVWDSTDKAARAAYSPLVRSELMYFPLPYQRIKHTGWEFEYFFQIEALNSTMTTDETKSLLNCLPRHRSPDTVVTENRPELTRAKRLQFSRQWKFPRCIRH